MVDLLKIAACSGQKWDKDIVKEFIIDDKYVSDHFFQGEPFEIDNVVNKDGVTDEGYYIHPSGHQYHGSGSLFIHTSKETFPVWLQVEYDPNIARSHRKGKPHVNIYVCVGSKKVEPPKRIRAIDSKYAIVELTDLINNEVFSFHRIRLKKTTHLI